MNISERDIVAFFLNTGTPDQNKRTEKWLKHNFASKNFEKLSAEFWNLDLAGEGSKEEKESALRNLYIKAYSQRRRKLIRISAIAASLFVIVSLTWFSASLFKEHEIKWKELYTEYTQKDSLVLSDGTKIWLNSGSRITYPATFAGTERNIFISGEAYFNVAHDKSKPFHVSAGPVKITVLGTEFNVRTANDMSKVDIELYDGSIMLTAGKEENIYLKPGEKVTYDSSSGAMTKSNFDSSNIAQWLIGGYDSGYKSLSEIISDFEKIYGIKVIIADESIAEKKYHIALAPGMKLQDVLETLNFDNNMVIHKYNELIIINSK